MNSYKFDFFKTLSRLAVYTGLAVAVFLFITVMILSVGSAENDEIVMPDVVGKYYVDVHNELIQSRLRINLVKKRYNDQSPGIVLHQSIPAGSKISPKTKIYLTVNQPEPILTMPSITGTPLQNAKAALERVNYDEEIYSLSIGAVTYIPSVDLPPDTVIAQYPPAGDTLSKDDKIFLLVSAEEGSPGSYPDITELKGQNISIATETLNRLNLDYRIRIKVKPFDKPNGFVNSVEKSRDGIFLDVFYEPGRFRYKNGLEKVSLDLDEKGRCEAVQIPQSTGEKERVFLTKKHREDEPVDIIFYRRGESRFQVYCGDRLIYNKKYVPDDLS